MHASLLTFIIALQDPGALSASQGTEEALAAIRPLWEIQTGG